MTRDHVAPTLSKPAALLVSIGLAIRLLCLLIFDPARSITGGDASSFLAWEAHQPPGYPFILSLIGIWGAVGLQSVVTICLALFTQARIGFLPALLIVSSPFFVVYEWRILSDSFAWQMVLAAFLLLAAPKGKWDAVIAGCLLGAAALVRDTWQYLPLFALPFAFLTRKPGPTAVAAGIAALTILPWQVSQGRVSISEGRMGYNLWIGTWERNSDWMLPGLDRANYPANAFTSSSQREWLLENPLVSPEADSRFRHAALERMKAEPVFVLSNWAARYYRLWLGTRTDQIDVRATRGSLIWLALKSAFWILNLLMLVIGAIGILVSARKWPLLIAPIIYLALIYVPFHNVETRYSLGALPFLYVFAAEGLCWLYSLARKFRRPERRKA